MREVEIYLIGSSTSWFTTAAWIKEKFEAYGWNISFVQFNYKAVEGAWFIRANVDSRYSKEQIAQNAAHVATNFISLPVSVLVITGDGAPISKRFTVTPPIVTPANQVVRPVTPGRNNQQESGSGGNNTGNPKNSPPPDDKESEFTKAYKKFAADFNVSPTTLGICAALAAILILRK
jgi:hypothetical protein